MERKISSHPSPIMVLTTANEEEEEEEEVYVAVKKDFSEGKSTLQWLLQNTSTELKMEKRRKIFITHVHVPAHIAGIKFPDARVVKEYRDNEREMIHRRLEDYVTLCLELKERAETLVVEAVDVAKGLLELVAQHGVAKLVMGAAADEHYSRNMKVPRSRTAIVMTQQADPSCRIWFVCKGNMVCTRGAVLDASRMALPSTSSLGSSSRESERLRSSPQGQAEPLGHVVPISDLHRSRPDNLGSFGGGIVATSSQTTTSRSLLPRCRFSSEGVPTVDHRDAISSRTSPRLNPLLSSSSDDMLSNLDYLSMYTDEEDAGRLLMLPFMQGSDGDLYFSSPRDGLVTNEDIVLDTEVYARLEEAIKEAENLRQEAYRESHRRQTAERKTIQALRKAKVLEHIYAKEVNKRKDIEIALAREKMEVETLKNQILETIQQCQMANMHKRELEHQISDSNSTIKDLEEKLQAAQHLLTTLQVEHEESQLNRDAAVREADELCQKKEPVTTSTHGLTNFLEFSYSEIERATRNFSSSLKIGGGYGSVYKGLLQNTIVAIRVLNHEGMQGQSEFLQKANVLSRIRHPNLVTLIGACPEAWALIYEFLPNGSLEEHLDCKNDDSLLTWQVRTRIATEICSSLIFLQSNKPYPIDHGDLKPDNILLDANLVSKLGDIGIRHLFQSDITTTPRYQYTILKGTFEYMDPEFLATGKLTPQSDVYSFGIILLRLLTGKPAVALVKKVKDALDKGLLHRMIDPSAGKWPFMKAKQLAHLGLRCCEKSWRSRPNLLWDVWSVLDPMLKTTLLSGPALSLGMLGEDTISVPNCFICPISQEIMSDPYIASDGFTYEAEAIKGWIGSGHDTSPMTNLKLLHNDLIPNRALRSAIQEWLQQNQQL